MATKIKTLPELIEAAGLDPELKAQFETALQSLTEANEASQKKAIDKALKAQSYQLVADHKKAIDKALKDQSDSLKAEHESALKSALETQSEELGEQLSETLLELEELKAKHATATKQIVGEYKAGNGRIYKFTDGTFNFIHGGERHSSKEALKDSDLMEELVEMGVGFLVEVTE